jgi:hypothetical protein
MGKAVTALNTPNDTRYFYPADANRELKKLPMKATLAMAEGAAICVEVSGSTTTGYHTIAGTTSANGQNVVGILSEPIVATDTDYGTAGKLKGVRVPKTREAKAFFYVGAGTFTAVDVGKIVQIHTDSLGLAVDTLGLGAEIVEYVSSTKGVCRFSCPIAVTA